MLKDEKSRSALQFPLHSAGICWQYELPLWLVMSQLGLSNAEPDGRTDWLPAVSGVGHQQDARRQAERVRVLANAHQQGSSAVAWDDRVGVMWCWAALAGRVYPRTRVVAAMSHWLAFLQQNHGGDVSDAQMRQIRRMIGHAKDSAMIHRYIDALVSQHVDVGAGSGRTEAATRAVQRRADARQSNERLRCAPSRATCSSVRFSANGTAKGKLLQQRLVTLSHVLASAIKSLDRACGFRAGAAGSADGRGAP